MRCLVTGGNGFLGSHLVRRLKDEGHFVRSVDRRQSNFGPSVADEVFYKDLRWPGLPMEWFKDVDEVYQLAADMGGAGYIFSGEHDADIMRNSSLINLNVLDCCRKAKVGRVFFSSSACVYQSFKPKIISFKPNTVDYTVGEPVLAYETTCREQDAYPANPDSEYGWEKLYAERLYQAYARNFDMQVRIGRFHNVYGPYGTWRGGREKAPAAICRKVAEATDKIEIWGDGEQTRSFMYISDAIAGVLYLTRSDFQGPLNLGSEEMVTINQLVALTCSIAGKAPSVKHVEGPLGVRGRNSDNTLIKEKLGWAPSISLREGMEKLYPWIAEQVCLTAGLD